MPVQPQHLIDGTSGASDCSSWWDVLPHHLATTILLSSVVSVHQHSARLVSSSWRDAIDQLITHASIALYHDGWRLTTAFVNLQQLDLSGCCQVLPRGVLAATFTSMASSLQHLNSLTLSTWCLAQPASGCTAAAYLARWFRHATRQPPVKPQLRDDSKYVLAMPRELGGLVHLQHLVVMPCPALSCFRQPACSKQVSVHIDESCWLR
eukprot:jgi/Chrzof1/468/Cz01g16270.t1